MLPASYIKVNDMQIAYYELGASGSATVFFLHGNSCSAGTWRKQFSSDLLAAYHLIAFDLPAHGQSDAAGDLDYSLSALGKIMAEAIKQLAGGKPFVLTGMSLGTNITMEACRWLGPAGVVLAGPSIIGDGFGLDQIAQPGVDLSPIFIENATMEAIIRYSQLVSASMKEEDHEHFVRDYLNVKPGFRSKLYEGISQNKYSDEIRLLKDRRNNLVVFGADERIVRANYLDQLADFCFQGSVFKIPGAGHLVHIDQPEVFNQLIADYLAEIITP